MKRHDTRPTLLLRLRDVDGAVANLTGATARFLMRQQNVVPVVVKVDREMDIIDPEDGVVRLLWNPEDTDTAGTFDAEVEVTYSDGKTKTYPNHTYDTITIVEDIA
jgi:hypothetical protein